MTFNDLVKILDKFENDESPKKGTHRFFLDRKTENDALLLQEGLIVSYPIDALIKKLDSLISVKFVEKISDDMQFTDRLYVSTNFKQETDFLKFKNILNVYGYFLSNDEFVSGVYEYDVEAKYPIKSPVPPTLYHVTMTKNLDRIKKIGLVPKKTIRPNFNTNQNRIYLFFTTNPIEDLPKLAHQLDEYDNDYSFLKINSAMLEVRGFEFYFDPKLPIGDFGNKTIGFFTLRNIPPEFIEVL